MSAALRAVQAEVVIDEERQLRLVAPLSIARPGRVRVVVLVPDDGDIDEAAWLHAASSNPAFEFLRDPEEDLYTWEDGRPFHDEA